MSGQGWPGAGAGPGPAPGRSEGQRIGILLAAVVVAVAASFGVALATGADTRDEGSMGGGQLPGGGLPGGLEGGLDGGPEGLGDLEGLETPDLDDLPDLEGLETPDAGLSGGTDTGGSSSGGSGGGDVVDPAPTTPQADPTLESYRSVAAGDCLATWMTDETSWVSDWPEVVDCGADNAGVWVSQTTGSTSSCPTDSGRSYLSYSSGGETIALCVTRQFEIGQCFLGTSDNSANLLSWIDCEAGSVPSPYTQIFNVTGVYSAPSNPTGNECARVAGDTTQYWWWTMDGDSTMLCAVVYSS